MSNDYVKVDAYLNGYRAAIKATFCPETGWFWKTLGEAHDKAENVDDFYDAIVEAVNKELGQ